MKLLFDLGSPDSPRRVVREQAGDPARKDALVSATPDFYRKARFRDQVCGEERLAAVCGQEGRSAFPLGRSRCQVGKCRAGCKTGEERFDGAVPILAEDRVPKRGHFPGVA